MIRKNHGKMADQLLTLFASLFGITRSRMLDIEIMCTMLVGDDDGFTHGDDVGPEESSTYIEWTAINPQTPVNCLYPILHNQMFTGAQKTPVNVW